MAGQPACTPPASYWLFDFHCAAQVEPSTCSKLSTQRLAEVWCTTASKCAAHILQPWQATGLFTRLCGAPMRPLVLVAALDEEQEGHQGRPEPRCTTRAFTPSVLAQAGRFMPHAA